MSPLVTVIVVVRDGAATIGRALASVTAQTLDRVELVVVDGASTDDTVAIVRAVAPNASLTNEPDLGPYDAMNKGVRRARGEWIYFLGADDTLISPHTLTTLRPVLEAPSLDVVYGDVLMRRGDRASRYDGPFRWWKLYAKNICHQSILFRRDFLLRFGLYALDYPLCSDWVHNMRWFADPTVRRTWVDLVIAEFQGDGLSSRRRDVAFRRDQDRIFREAFGTRRWLVVYGAWHLNGVRERAQILGRRVARSVRARSGG